MKVLHIDKQSRKLKSLLIFILAMFLISCTSEKSADDIINKSINVHGGELYRNSEITFDYRGKQFKIIKDGYKFSYERTYKDSSANDVKEIIFNKGTKKFINEEEIELDQRGVNRIDGAVNSVVYFTLLPQPLNDKAVIKKYIGEAVIEGINYYKIEVLFKQEGGGRDYDDRYVYWINAESYMMDYFAYYFHVNGGGSRFRKMINKRNVNGIIFYDHINYSSDKIKMNIEDYDKLVGSEELKKVSDVKIENVKVKHVK